MKKKQVYMGTPRCAVNTTRMCSEMPEKPLVDIYSAIIMSPGMIDMQK